MKRVLVAGGAGYIGTRMCNELCHDYDITVVDYFWFGDHLDSKITKIKKDILTLTSEDLKCYDAIIFIAGLSNDPMANFRPYLNFVGNSSIPTYLAYIAKQAGVKRFICASSCSVYGFTDNKTLSEIDTVRPAYPYGISKLQCEFGITVLEDDNFKPILFRKGTVGGYSEKMRYDLVVNTMIMSALTKKKITVNDPTLWRPLIDIRDVIQGYKLALEADLDVSGIFNLSGFNYTIGELGKLIASKIQSIGYDVELELLSIPDIRNYKVSTDKAEKLLKYSPRFTPEDSLSEIFTKIDFNDYDFNNPQYYNIQVFKSVI